MNKHANRTLRLLRAAGLGRRHVTQMLLDGGADVMAGGHSGETGLHSAAGGGQTEMVSYLLPLIGEVDVRDEFGGTPLHLGHPAAPDRCHPTPLGARRRTQRR